MYALACLPLGMRGPLTVTTRHVPPRVARHHPSLLPPRHVPHHRRQARHKAQPRGTPQPHNAHPQPNRVVRFKQPRLHNEPYPRVPQTAQPFKTDQPQPPPAVQQPHARQPQTARHAPRAQTHEPQQIPVRRQRPPSSQTIQSAAKYFTNAWTNSAPIKMQTYAVAHAHRVITNSMT